MVIRLATCSDLKALMKIFDGARSIMRASGNLNQWNNGYPSEDVVLADISSGHCFVACDGEAIIGTMALIQGPDPTYEYIEGNWPDESPYYVIHRIATDAPGRNIAVRMFDWALEHMASNGCHSLRIDTHRDNCIMKHILAGYGFSECGVIYLLNGDPRDAYCYINRQCCYH